MPDITRAPAQLRYGQVLNESRADVGRVHAVVRCRHPDDEFPRWRLLPKQIHAYTKTMPDKRY